MKRRLDGAGISGRTVLLAVAATVAGALACGEVAALGAVSKASSTVSRAPEGRGGVGAIRRDAGAASPIVEGLPFVVQWNEIALAAVRDGAARPTVTAHRLFLLSAAMYDAWAAYDEVAAPYALDPGERRPPTERTEANRREAISVAAYHAVRMLFSEHERRERHARDYLRALGYAPSRPRSDTPAGIGYRAAEAVFDHRADDGSNFADDYAPIASRRYPEPYEPVNTPTAIDQLDEFPRGFDPNRWQPLRVPTGVSLDALGRPVVDALNLDSFGDQRFLTPHWGAVRPFALEDAAQFRPPPPPMYGSAAPYTDARGERFASGTDAWIEQTDEVLAYSATLDDERKVIAEFWADGPRTESPPGHWNQLAHGVVERERLDDGESVRLFFALNGALLDASIAAWEAKRHYDYIRPASAIRWYYNDDPVAAWAGPGLGTDTILGADWSPYQRLDFVTPPFPEYVSGHSAFSRAAAEVLTAFVGDGTFYDGTTRTSQDIDGDGTPDLIGEFVARRGTLLVEPGPASAVTLRWPTFRDAADEAGISRLYGGIHFRDGDLRGRELGREVGRRASEVALRYFEGERIGH